MLVLAPKNDCLAVTVTTGSLDATNANAFKERVKAALVPPIVRAELDLAQVEFMDSSGIGAILSVYKHLNSQLVLLNPQPTVLSILELLRLHRIFQIEKRGV